MDDTKQIPNSKLWTYVFTNWMGWRPAFVKHKDGNEEVVSFLCMEVSGNAYVFKYPYEEEDIGFSVNPKFIRICGIWESLYVHFALKAIKVFPNLIRI